MYSVDFFGCLRYRESFLITLLNSYLTYFQSKVLLIEFKAMMAASSRKMEKRFAAVILSYFHEVVSIFIAKIGIIGNEKQRLSNETKH